MKRFGPVFSLVLIGLTCKLPAAEVAAIDNFQLAAARRNRVLSVPNFERTPDALMASVTDAIAKGNSALDQIGSQNLDHIAFENTAGALENLRAESSVVANRVTLIAETHPDSLMRAAADRA